MTAEILKFDPEDFLWDLVERDVQAYLRGDPRLGMNEEGNIGRALGFRLQHHIPAIRECWAEARRVKAKRDQQMKERA
jgi:hypothetical protein